MQRVSGYWRAFLGIISVSQRAGGGTLKTKCCLCPFLNAAQNPTPSWDYCSLFHLDAPCNLYSVLFSLQQASMHVFSALSTLQKISVRDRYCCLLFDEMSIRENVRFNQELDCIESFEDYGTEGTCNFALLFMARGLHRKWKKPVAYYFIRGSTKAGLLKKFLEEVLGTCQNVGLHVGATVCDMGANNVSSLQMLGATRCKPFSEFQNRDCDSIWSSTPPEMHWEPFPQIWCAVQVWAHAQPASCHCKVGTHFKYVQMGQK